MRSASAALKAIDEQAAQDGQQAMLRQTRATTPELRLLQKHHAAMGEDDARRLSKLDPRQHLFGCRCLLCDKIERECPIDGCNQTLIGSVNLARHLEGHKKKAQTARAREQSERRKRLEPAGLGFVAALIGDPDRAATLDLRALREFESRIAAAAGQKRRKVRLGAARNALTSIQENPQGSTVLATDAPNTIAAVVYRLAILSGTSPRAVIAALLSWGIEHFAADVRKMHAAAPPHVAKALSQPATKVEKKIRLYPSAEESIA